MFQLNKIFNDMEVLLFFKINEYFTDILVHMHSKANNNVIKMVTYEIK